MISYQGNSEQEKIGDEFMNSLFLICKQNQTQDIDHCITINDE